MSSTCSNLQECCNFIHIKRNGGDGNFSTLKRGSVVILGKDESCDFRIQVPSVSSRHASLRVDKSGKVYTSSLVENAPVYLNGEAVRNEALIRNKDILKVGTCSFRFEYNDGVLSPMQTAPNTAEDKVSTENSKKPKSPSTPKPTPSKSPSTPKSGKENNTTPSSQNVSNTVVNSSKEKVPTPIVPRQHSVTKQLRRRSSLVSIPEQEEVVSTPKYTASGSAEKHVEQRTSRRSLRNTSLMSIPEEDEATAMPSPRKRKRESSVTEWFLRKSARKSVSFGPVLSPECFDKTLPPSTPIKVGTLPGGIRRSLPPAPLSKPSPAPSSAECSLLSEPEVVSSTEDEGAEESEGEDATVSQDDTEGEGVMTSEGEGIQDADSDTINEGGHDSEGEEDAQEDAQSSEGEDQEREETDVEYSMTGFEEGDNRSQVEESSGDEQSVVEDSTIVRPETKKGLSTPLRRGIEAKPLLRKTKRALPSPLKNEIESKPKLRRNIKRSLPTPLSKAIRMKAVLRKTKLMLSTPLRKAILQKPSLKRIKKPSMPTPVRKGIENQPPLKKTKRSLPTPVRMNIETKPSLKKTKQSMSTPVRKGIEAKPSLKKTKQSMPTPVRKGIEAQPSLKKTKRSMATDLQEAIQAGTVLHTNKKSLPVAIRNALEGKPALRTTKRVLPAALCEEIVQGVKLRATKKCLPSLPSSLQAQIQSGVKLQNTMLTMPLELQNGIEAGAATLRHVSPKSEPKSATQKKPTVVSPFPAVRQARKRVIGATDEVTETPLPVPPSKKRRLVAPASPQPFSFDQFLKGTNGSVDLSGIHALHSNSKVEFSASHTEMSLAKLPVPSEPAPDTSLFQLGVDDKSTRPNGVRATRSKTTTDGHSRNTRGKQKVGLTDLGTAAKRVTRSNARGISVHTNEGNGAVSAAAMESAQTLVPSSATDDVPSGRKKATRNTSKKVEKVPLEMIPEQPGQPEMSVGSNDTQQQESSHKPSKSEETSSMKQERSKRGTKSLKRDNIIPVTHSETNAMLPGLDPGKNKPGKASRSLKQLLVTPVKPAISVVVSVPETTQTKSSANSFGPKRITRVSRKAEVDVCVPEEYVQQDISLQGAHSKKLKVEHTSVDEIPRKVKRSSKQQGKVSVEILPQEMASAIEQTTAAPVSVCEKRNRQVEQDTIGSDAGKTKRPLRSSKQGDGCVDQNSGASEEPPSTKRRRKVEQGANEKYDRTTRSVKQMDTDVILEGSNIEPVPTKQKRATRSVKSNPTDEDVSQQEKRSELDQPNVATIPKRATRSSKLK